MAACCWGIRLEHEVTEHGKNVERAAAREPGREDRPSTQEAQACPWRSGGVVRRWASAWASCSRWRQWNEEMESKGTPARRIEFPVWAAGCVGWWLACLYHISGCAAGRECGEVDTRVFSRNRHVHPFSGAQDFHAGSSRADRRLVSLPARPSQLPGPGGAAPDRAGLSRHARLLSQAQQMEPGRPELSDVELDLRAQSRQPAPDEPDVQDRGARPQHHLVRRGPIR